MAPGDYSKTDGKQRAVWSQPDGRVVVSGTLEHYEAVIIESGTALLEDYFFLDDSIARWQVAVPIMAVPVGAAVVKTVALAASANDSWSDDAGGALWAIDEVHVEEDTNTRQLSLVAHVAGGGQGCGLERIAYHITIFIQGRRYIADPEAIVELDIA